MTATMIAIGKIKKLPSHVSETCRVATPRVDGLLMDMSADIFAQNDGSRAGRIK